MTAIRTLTCACCDARVIGRQWHNRDTGYGVCAGCVAWMVKRGTSADEIQSLYGIAGVHWDVATPSVAP